MAHKRLLVTGSTGQLGQSIQKIHSEYTDVEFTFVDRNTLDLSCAKSIDDYFQKHQYDIIVNCAAYTKVDKAETEAELADQINHQAVRQLAQIAKNNEAILIHISTDYVFNGQMYRPYQESDTTDPQCVYGMTKLRGEQAFLDINPNGCMIRTSWVYSEYGHNFVKTMLRLGSERDELGIIFDQIGTPTYAKDLARVILSIVLNDVCAEVLESSQATDKIFHFSNEGVCSWYDFAKTVFELNGAQCKVNPIETKDYPTPASRPHYSVMNKRKIKHTFDLNIPYWKDSLKRCVETLKEVSE